MTSSAREDLSALKLDFLEYLELERNVSQNTIENYNHYLIRFLEFVGEIKPSGIDLDLIKKYRLHLARWIDPETKKPLKRKTQNYFMIALRSFLKYLNRIDVTSLSPEKVELGEVEASPLKVLENSDLEHLLAAPDLTTPDGLRDKAILETLFSTGLRVSELASLNRDTINFERREFPIIGKGGKERIVFLSEEACETIANALDVRKDPYKPLFIRFQGRQDPSDDGENMRLTTRSIERIVEKYVKAVGLTVKATPHTLRHSFATDLLVNGADIRSVQEMLGHANIATTQIYTHITNKQLREVHKAFHSKNKPE
ncbi:MAG TPA: tyrosine-type recombinase/integrase [Patescibacteria group bacterium]|nr:tyrosine-type recombinase/integrase [Patescibacteria group bacterium]